MDISAVKSIATRAAGRGLLQFSKHSPELLTGVGIVGVITAAVFASKATLQAPDIAAQHKTYVAELKGVLQTGDITPAEYNKALTRTFSHTAIQFIKLYGPAVTLGLSSIGCIVGAHGIMKKRNVALMAAYKTVEEAYNKYRARVIEDQGPLKDLEYRFGTQEVTRVNEKTKKEETVKVLDPNGISKYARFFDELNLQWKNVPEYNLLFLKAQQNMATDRLLSRGHLFLNEVYESLGLPHTKEGAIVGWVVTKDGTGDNFVDFGLYDVDNAKAREFVNGYETAILLDFNVNGVIFDKI